jgi:hypothetical protein
MNNTNVCENKKRLLQATRRRHQSGELSMIEAGAVLAAEAPLALAVTEGGKCVVGPSTTYNDSAAATACSSAGNNASIDMYVTRN